MRNFTIYLTLLLCVLASKMLAQESFETKAKKIADKIEKITKDEKATLKLEIEEVNIQLEKGTITSDQANSKKQQLAQARATIIENKVAVAQEELKDLVQQKVDGKIREQDSTKKYTLTFSKFKHKHNDTDSIQSEKRTTSQLVSAVGLNNLVTNGKLNDSDYRFWGSHFYELGFTYNSRILKNNNLLHAKYGLSLMYNNVRPTGNRSFSVSGNQTNLVVNPVDLNDSRFRNVYLMMPVHLEFDFSKNKDNGDKTFFRTHQGFRLGIGAYTGINLKSKQIINYDDNDLKVRQRVRGDFNTNNFIYGLSSYIGYKETSLYVKYDLNPLFKDNVVKQNNISLGLRFDLN